MSKQIILSICIPTYNRGHILKDVIEHYIACPEFNEEVELVISDNASTDDTAEICRYYCLHHSNIRYYRNEVNIRDENFVRVLDLGHGEYLKLFNDWVYCSNESLSYIKKKLKENQAKKPPIFFTSNHLYTSYKAEEVKGAGLDDYVKIVSTFVTYNNLFGVWADHWHKILDKRRYAHLQLQQQDWSYQVVADKGECLIFDRPVFWSSNISLGKRGGYNWFQIHLDNYYKIMTPFIEKGLITKETYEQDRHNLLKHFRPEFCNVFFYRLNENWQFETKGTWKILLKYYKNDPFFYWYLVKLPFFYLYCLSLNCRSFIISSVRK